MNKAKPPIGDEHLVAYLDGELDPTSQQDIEGQLAADENLRQRLALLEQSWNLLDDLPDTDVADDFAQTTVTLAASSIRSRSRQPWRVWVLGGLIGFATIAIPMWVRQQQRLLDLPIIQNLELYQVADSLQFLEMLEEEGLFVEDVEDVL